MFFLATCLLLWLALFPDVREGFARGLQRLWRVLAGGASGVGLRVASRAQDSGAAVRHSSSWMSAGLRRHRTVLLASLVLLTVPALLILALRQQVALDGYGDEHDATGNPLIAELLRGERLIPPLPPPPDVFTTEEVQRVMPEIRTADRKWDRLDTDLQQRVLAVYRVMREQYGYEMVIVEGYRSPERQAALPAAVTRAGPWQSCHQYGLAVDSAVFRDGKLQWDLGDEWVRNGYMLYGRLSREAGMQWGGDWRSFKDYPHVENTPACAAARKARLRGA